MSQVSRLICNINGTLIITPSYLLALRRNFRMFYGPLQQLLSRSKYEKRAIRVLARSKEWWENRSLFLFHCSQYRSSFVQLNYCVHVVYYTGICQVTQSDEVHAQHTNPTSVGPVGGIQSATLRTLWLNLKRLAYRLLQEIALLVKEAQEWHSSVSA